MTPFRRDTNIEWLPKPNEARWELSNELPAAELITAAHGFVFGANEQLLLIRHFRNGWVIPGGHVESGETPLEALRREVREEAGLEIEGPELFVWQRIRLLGTRPENYKYPFPESYQVFYFAGAAEIGEFQISEDSLERRFFSIEAALDWPWGRLYRDLILCALENHRSRTKPTFRLCQSRSVAAVQALSLHLNSSSRD